MFAHVRTRSAFTLIELLVVIAIIALLVGILLPSLAGARNEARAIVCANNMRQVAIGVVTYNASNRDFQPPAYVYAEVSDPDGPWRVDLQGQTPTANQFYRHWSSALMADGNGGTPEDAFKCPSTARGGAPATNPGSNVNDWEVGQIARNPGGGSQSSPGDVKDQQAKRVAITGNAAVFPRNKFSTAFGGGRRNIFITAGIISLPSSTILATEFFDNKNNWETLRDGSGYILSHRSINPFSGGSTGSNVYAEPNFGSGPRFFYPDPKTLLTTDQIGLNVINNADTNLNAVGRHHPGGRSASRQGGTANFSFLDGHVERKSVYDTIEKRQWGDRFYTLSGGNEVDMKTFLQ